MTETAAHHQNMHMHILWVVASDRGDVLLGETGNLRACPDIHAPIRDAHGGVDRFQRRMGKIGRAIFRLKGSIGERGINVAIVARFRFVLLPRRAHL